MTTQKDPLFVIHPEDWADFVNQLSQESDRGAALVGAAFLDHLLAALIEGFLIDDRKSLKDVLEGHFAPLSSLASRISMAFSLGLISEDEQHDLDLIRKVRNVFAHELTSSAFSAGKIEEILSKLRIPRLVPEGLYDVEQLEARMLFINATAMLATFIDKRRRIISDKREPARKFYIEISDSPP